MATFELLRNESVDCSIQVEAESSSQILHDGCMKKSSETTMPELPDLSELIDKLKNDRRFHEVINEKNKDLLHSNDLEHFHQTFNVTGLRPSFVNHSGYVILILNDCGSMFRWDKMSQDFDYLGNSLREGLTNYIYHPEKICTIIEFTGEMIPREELRYQSIKKLHGLKFQSFAKMLIHSDYYQEGKESIQIYRNEKTYKFTDSVEEFQKSDWLEYEILNTYN
ncbi:4392_t:CDS:2, partial [Racocetra persica]